MSLIVELGEAETRLSGFLAKVEAGEQVVIARGHQPIARLTRVPEAEDFAALVAEAKASRAKRAKTSPCELPPWRDGGRRLQMALVGDASLAGASSPPKEQNDATDRAMLSFDPNSRRALSLLCFRSGSLILVVWRRPGAISKRHMWTGLLAPSRNSKRRRPAFGQKILLCLRTLNRCRTEAQISAAALLVVTACVAGAAPKCGSRRKRQENSLQEWQMGVF